MENIQNLSDKKLYNLCQEYGKNIRTWKRKFAALLPEIEKRRLYKKYKFYSIYEFAAKLGGFSKKTVEEILRTYRKVQNKPLLKAQIEKQGWAKVRAITAIAENREEKDLVYMVRSMSKNVLEEAVRIIKKQDLSERNQGLFENEDKNRNQEFSERNQELFEKNQDSLRETAEEGQNPPQEIPEANNFPPGWKKFTKISFQIDQETEFKLRIFQQKLEKERKEKIPFNEVLKTLLERVGEKQEIRKGVEESRDKRKVREAV